MPFILASALLNTLSFTVVIPILPFLVSRRLGPGSALTAIYVGLLVSSFALCQFLAAPGLGAVSDRHGRRPVLLLCLLGSAIGYLVLATSGTLWMLFLGRIIDGLTGGNISTIYAYVADITAGRDRGRYFGLLGAVSGLGFVLGPALGGLLGGISLTLPLYAAAGITLLNMAWGYFVLPESLAPEHRSAQLQVGHLNPFYQLRRAFGFPAVRRLLLLGLLFFITAAGLQSNFAVYLQRIFSFGPAGIGFVLLAVGVVDILAQGLLTARLLPRLGLGRLAQLGMLINALGFFMYAALPWLSSQLFLYISIIVFNIGTGFIEPTYGGLLSNSVERGMQGRIQGAGQSVQSLARIAGPLATAWLYGFHPALPYAVNAVLVMAVLVLLSFSLPLIRAHAPEPEAV